MLLCPSCPSMAVIISIISFSLSGSSIAFLLAPTWNEGYVRYQLSSSVSPKYGRRMDLSPSRPGNAITSVPVPLYIASLPCIYRSLGSRFTMSSCSEVMPALSLKSKNLSNTGIHTSSDSLSAEPLSYFCLHSLPSIERS